jgi:hypothetical protein
MRYPCIGFPLCLKTFENGYVLRSHQLSCEHAQREIYAKNSHQEHVRSIQYDYKINGIKVNQFYPKFTGLDHTQKLQFRDRFQLGGTTKEPYRRLRQPLDPSVVTSQTKSTAMDLSGYYT